MKLQPAPESLESRIALSISAFIDALDAPAGTTGIEYSATNAIAVGSDFGFDGLLGFPTGANDKFLMMSTGDATRITSPTGYSKHGTDFESKGETGDFANIHLNLQVPAGARHLKFDFLFLTNEDPGSTTFPDYFHVDVDPGTGSQRILDQTVANTPYIGGGSTDGTIFRSRSILQSLDYAVPAGATNLSLDFSMSDVGDGTGDTAVLLDNLHFELGAKVVYLNFEGGTTSLIAAGSSMTLPAFQPADIGSAVARATLIEQIRSDVQAKYAGFDVSFVTTQPASGDYATMIIGGNNDNVVTLNTNPALGAVANPLLVKNLGTSTTVRAIKNLGATGVLFGQAQAVDIGNTNVNDTGVIFSGVFNNFYTSLGDPVSEIEKRLVVTISHELGHDLGLRHVTNAFNGNPGSTGSNIMAQNSPRSTATTFEDASRALAETWADGNTAQNDKTYLDSVLGTAGTTGLHIGYSPREVVKYILAHIPFVHLYNVYLGVFPGQPADSDADTDASPLVQFYPELSGTEALTLPLFSPDDKIMFYGSTTPSGAPDVFSGQQTGGNLDYAAAIVPLYDTLGNPVAIHTSTGDPQTPGSFTSGADMTLEANPFTMALLPPGTYQDSDGDSYTVKLTGKGTLGFSMLDPDGDGKGPIDQIFIQGTTAKDKVSIAVKKASGAMSDGLVSIGEIRGTTLGAIDAKASNLIGAGVNVGNFLGSLTVRDILNGADISIGGAELFKTSITARDIADGTAIVSDSTISKLTAARVGDGSITAPVLGKLSVKGDKKAAIGGDFASDVTLAHTAFLSPAALKKNILGSVTIAGLTHDATFSLAGSAGAFKTGLFADSSILINAIVFNPTDPLNNFIYTDSNPDHGKLASFKATGIKDSMQAAFDNSTIIAKIIGGVSLASIDTANGGKVFGIAADESIAAVTSTAPAFKYDKAGAATQTSGDFAVKIV